MQKIKTLFQRDAMRQALVTPLVEEDCAWVLAGEGVASRKVDGTCCLVRGGRLYKRIDWDAKKGPAPGVWLHWDFDPAQRSGHGWFPVSEGPEDWMHREAWALGVDDRGELFRDGTYELVGPRIGKNPEKIERNVLVPHGRDAIDAPRTFDGLRDFLATFNGEGLVWRTGDGRYAKIKRRDFGFAWPIYPKPEPKP